MTNSHVYTHPTDPKGFHKLRVAAHKDIHVLESLGCCKNCGLSVTSINGSFIDTETEFGTMLLCDRCAMGDSKESVVMQ